nr:reverse transcriptase domain-containing protein [Tanacetum cinerariifolium]
TVNQGMSVEEIERVVAQRVTNVIKAIAIYETKTNLAHKSMSQTERREEKVAENASNKRKWGSNHNRSLSQQNKGHKVPRAHTAWPIKKKAYAGSLPLRNQCKSNHSGSCTVKCGNCKEDEGCYECGSLRHYKSKCPMVKFHKRMDMIRERIRASKPKTMQDAIGIATKLMNKKIGTLVECQTENQKSTDEEYAIAVRDFKKFFRRRGKFVQKPYYDKMNLQKAKEDKNEKEDWRCFKYGDPNHFISDCTKHSFSDQKTFVVECWSDNGDDSKKEEIFLMA